jgi:hypothetical protein
LTDVKTPLASLNPVLYVRQTAFTFAAVRQFSTNNPRYVNDMTVSARHPLAITRCQICVSDSARQDFAVWIWNVDEARTGIPDEVRRVNCSLAVIA